MSQAKLTHTLGDNINEKLLIWDHLGCFIKKLCRHMAQGSNGVPRLRDRELKNDRHAICKGGRDKLRGEHGKMSVDFASEAPRCQRISSITPQITFDQGVIGGFSQGALGARFIRAATGRPKCPTRNIQIRPRNHGGFYWREIMTQEHQGMTAWAAVAPTMTAGKPSLLVDAP